MFDITFLDEQQKKQKVWQTSWAITTRSIGVMIMVHGDDQGLILPPRVAQTQVVIIPIVKKNADNKAIMDACDAVHASLKKAGVRVKVDDRTNYNPGWKYGHWELKGVPIRIEVGPNDVKKNQVTWVRRVDSKKQELAIDQIHTVSLGEMK